MFHGKPALHTTMPLLRTMLSGIAPSENRQYKAKMMIIHKNVSEATSYDSNFQPLIMAAILKIQNGG